MITILDTSSAKMNSSGVNTSVYLAIVSAPVHFAFSKEANSLERPVF